MKKKTLTLNRKTDQSTKPVDQKAEAVVEADPEKRFLNGVAIHPSPGIRLELGSGSWGQVLHFTFAVFEKESRGGLTPSALFFNCIISGISQ